jgi:SH3 domain protein
VLCGASIGSLLALPAALAATALLAATPAAADQAWVRGNLRLNLRSGPGTQFRIIGALNTGDEVENLEQGDEWVKVKVEDGLSGWIPIGYLDTSAPPEIRLQQAEDEASRLGARLEANEAAIANLTARNEELAGRDAAQGGDIERLTAETTELRANRRWPEWVTGASVLAFGMLLGAILHRSATRRPQARIRL